MRLLLVELRRLFARRFFWIGALIMLAGFAAVLVITAAQSSLPTAADRASAQQLADEQAASVRADREACEESQRPGAEPPTDPNLERFQPGFNCSDIVPPTADQFLSARPFQLTENLEEITHSVTVVLALFAFLVGATAVGAEWHHGTMAALLLWETRRLRVFAGKLFALLGGVSLLALAGYATSAVGFWGVAKLRGEVGDLTVDFQRDIGLVTLRGFALVLTAAMAGFALAYMLRRTAAALGVLIGYFGVVEVGTRVFFNEGAEPYLLTSYVVAWLSNGFTILRYNCDQRGRLRAADDRPGAVARRAVCRRRRGAPAGGVGAGLPPARGRVDDHARAAHPALAGTALPARRHLGRRRGELRALEFRCGGRRTLPLRRGRRARLPADCGRAADPAAGIDLPRVARLRAGRRPRPALRVPRARPLGPQGRPALQRGQAARRPVREGVRRHGPVRPRALRPHRRPVRRPTGSARFGAVRAALGRGAAGGWVAAHPAAGAVGEHRHLRAARPRLHQEPPRHPARATRHLRRPGSPGRDRAPAQARRHLRRAAAGAPVRHRAVARRSRAHQLLGLQQPGLLRAGRPVRGQR